MTITLTQTSDRLTRSASAVAAVLLAGLVVFQIVLAFGAPVGRVAYGGATEHPGVELRISSAVAAVVWALAALVILRRGGHRVPRLVPDRALPIVMWIIIGLLTVGLLLNLITPSQLERLIWAPVTFAILATTIVDRTRRSTTSGRSSVQITMNPAETTIQPIPPRITAHSTRAPHPKAHCRRSRGTDMAVATAATPTASTSSVLDAAAC